VREADEAEFRAYAAARLRSLRRTSFLLCGDWHRADDAVQVVLTKLYVNWEKVNRLDRLEGYVRTMLVRATFDHRRRFWWRQEITSAQVPDTAHATNNNSAQADDVENRVVLMAALAKMPPRQRAVVVLRYWDDLDITETAHVLNCSEGTVKSQSARGLANLRTLLTDSQLVEGQAS
jgi:RNA polymerase sigma-70 factor (sigma-E family)